MNDSQISRTSTIIDAHVGKRVAYFRRKRDMSQIDLGNEIGVSFQQVQKYENGKNRISAGRLWEICKVFQLTPNDFYDGLPMPNNLDLNIFPKLTTA